MIRSTKSRPWLLVAAYDVSLGETSEGYIATNVLSRLSHSFRIVLVTRRNNQARLLARPEFKAACPSVRILGFDLPNWASWWKRGARLYGPYAYLWQVFWPLALRSHARFTKTIKLVHVLNFHNDSIPTLAWLLGRPLVWGPINHNELIAPWRRAHWPTARTLMHKASFLLRCIAWRLDPLLWLTKHKAAAILSAGPWVDRRLQLQHKTTLIHLGQVGVDATEFSIPLEGRPSQSGADRTLLVTAGRLDWLKGVDIALEALTHLPERFHLLVLGNGPAETRLKYLTQVLGLTERVEFRPPVPRAELPRIYAAARAFLFTSPEAAGLAWIEALCCGLPVVGFAGNSELTNASRHLPGVTLASEGGDRGRNLHNYANAILVANKKSTDRAQISAAAVERYGWDRMVRVIDSAYTRCPD